MRYILHFILSMVLLVQFSLSQTGLKKGFIAGFGAGIGFPATESTFKDNYDYGFNLSATGSYKLNNLYLIRGGIHFSKFPFTEIDIKKGSLRAVVMNAEFIIGAFNSKQKLHPYGVAGVGLYFLTSDLVIAGTESIDTENDIGFGIGGGVSVDLSKNLGIFAEVQYNHMVSGWDTKGYIPVRGGILISLE